MIPPMRCSVSSMRWTRMRSRNGRTFIGNLLLLIVRYGARQEGRWQEPEGLPSCASCPVSISIRLRGDVHLDRPRPGFLTQRNAHGEDTVLVLGRDPIRVDGLRQRERAAERAIAPLDVVVLLVLHVVERLLLALDRQHEVLDVDVDVVTRHRRELGLEHDLLVAGLEDVHRRHPRARRRESEIAEWIPTNDSHGLILLVKKTGPAVHRTYRPTWPYRVSAYSASTTSASFTVLDCWLPPDASGAGACACLWSCSAIGCDARCSSSVAFRIPARSSVCATRLTSAIAASTVESSPTAIFVRLALTVFSTWYASESAGLRASIRSRRAWSSEAWLCASFTIRSTSPFDRPLDPLMVIFCSLPVAMSFAATLTMPLASMSNATSI